jgi:TonB family protein
MRCVYEIVSWLPSVLKGRGDPSPHAGWLGTTLCLGLASLVLVSVSAVFGWSATTFLAPDDSARVPLAPLDGTLRRSPTHISEFAPVSDPLALPKCGNVRPPEALVTPDPLLQAQDEDLRVRVSFIVGTDGHVHSAFVLNSGGPSEDEVVLRAIRAWRYRPALCNGVPTDSEALVRFSIR